MTKPGKTTTTTTTQACTDLPGWADAWETHAKITQVIHNGAGVTISVSEASRRTRHVVHVVVAVTRFPHWVMTTLTKANFLMLAMDIATLFKAFTRGEGRRHAVCLREHR